MARPPDHGMSKTTEFKIWQGIHQRCYNPNSDKFYLYGGRGIKVEDIRWFSFMHFFNDMGKRPANKSLDRIDSNKGYYKENCRWADVFQQNNNRRNVKMIEYKGQLMPMKYWTDMFGMTVPALRHRLKIGQSVKDALETPVKKYNLK